MDDWTWAQTLSVCCAVTMICSFLASCIDGVSLARKDCGARGVDWASVTATVLFVLAILSAMAAWVCVWWGV